MAIALVAHVAVAGANTSTTAAIDTTGCNLIVINLSFLSTVSFTISDNKGNTYTHLTIFSNPNVGSTTSAQLWYVSNPTVGAGHTFTFTATGIFAVMCVQAFSGAKHTSPLDSEGGSDNAQGSGQTTITEGPLTPSAIGSVVVAGLLVNATNQISNGTISLGTVSDGIPFSNGNNLGGAMAAYFPPDNPPIAVNLTWTSHADPGRLAATMAVFLQEPPAPVGARVDQSAIEISVLQQSIARAFVDQSAVEIGVLVGITCGGPSSGTVGKAYSHTFPVSSGNTPYVFSISIGSLPPGLTLNTSTGVVSGTPTTPGNYVFVVTVTDALNVTASVTCSIVIQTGQRFGIVFRGWKLYPTSPCDTEASVAPEEEHVERAV